MFFFAFNGCLYVTMYDCKCRLQINEFNWIKWHIKTNSGWNRCFWIDGLINILIEMTFFRYWMMLVIIVFLVILLQQLIIINRTIWFSPSHKYKLNMFNIKFVLSLPIILPTALLTKSEWHLYVGAQHINDKIDIFSNDS